MPVAFVMVNTEPGAESRVIDALRSVEGVKEAYMVYGAYDLVVKVESETASEVKEIVESKVRRLEGVRSTLTLVEAR